MNWIPLTGVDTHSADSAVSQSSMAAHGSRSTSVPALDAGSKDAATRTARSGSGAGHRTGGTIVVMKKIDKASPLFKQASATGTVFSTARLDVAEGGAWKHYKLIDVIVSSFESTGGDRPSESITFTFRKIEME